jgi:hypothetical protein
MAMSLVKRLLPDQMYDELKADRKILIKTPDGRVRSEIHFKSGDNPDSLRGFPVSFFIIDEAARMSYDSFVSVMTTVTQTRGRGIIISTPKGRGWFYDVYQRGEKISKEGYAKYQPHLPTCPGPKSIDPLETDPDKMGCDCPNTDPWWEWYSIRMPTWTNPTVPAQSVYEAKKNLPEDVFAQEFAAIFQNESAGVFKGIKGCMRGVLQEPNPGESYAIGVDLGRLRDYTVLTVMSRSQKHVVAFERFNKISWELQYNRIKALSQQYNNAVCVIDYTGIGDPIVEALRSGGVPVEPYKIGGSLSKQQLIEKLRVCIEKSRISFPANLPFLIDELERYEYKVSETGVVRYEAPEGHHDDCVVSLALVTWLADQEPFTYKFSQRRGF